MSSSNIGKVTISYFFNSKNQTVTDSGTVTISNSNYSDCSANISDVNFPNPNEGGIEGGIVIQFNGINSQIQDLKVTFFQSKNVSEAGSIPVSLVTVFIDVTLENNNSIIFNSDPLSFLTSNDALLSNYNAFIFWIPQPPDNTVSFSQEAIDAGKNAGSITSYVLNVLDPNRLYLSDKAELEIINSAKLAGSHSLSALESIGDAFQKTSLAFKVNRTS